MFVFEHGKTPIYVKVTICHGMRANECNAAAKVNGEYGMRQMVV